VNSKGRKEKKRLETDLSSIMGLFSIYETKRMKELSNPGMLFVPPAFTSTIFGMSGSCGPGGASFWVYLLGCRGNTWSF
jgi:Mg2+ and Co2+ transporter CorA